MKFFEKYFPETRRFRKFAWIYLCLFLTLFGNLFFRQVWEREDYLEMERMQGQRRIIRPGARGDITDRENNLLIGNRAHYSAALHLELLSKEIWERKVELRRLSYQLKENLLQRTRLSLEDLLQFCNSIDHLRKRGLVLTGKDSSDSHSSLWIGSSKKDFDWKRKREWSATLKPSYFFEGQKFSINGSENRLLACAGGLLSIEFQLDKQGIPIPKVKNTSTSTNWFWSDGGDTDEKFINFTSDGYSLSWEARLSVVCEYLEKVNQLTGRNLDLTMEQLQKHWRQKLVLPLVLCSDLTNHEYAALVERLPPDSPIQVQAQAVRHYPEKSLASHVLGYVGSGYESNPETLSGSDLATFELQGRTGKAGVEKTFDTLLRGRDGGDIWIVSPMGSRFERLERQPSQKGNTLRLTLDMNLQSIAEDSIDRMVAKVAQQRILPDKDWARTLERRTSRALIGSDETEVSAELLLSAFKDAPFPLNETQASTVAGFKGTPTDAKRLLKLLYAQGVLKKGNSNPESYQIAPPPPPPGAAVLIDLQNFEILVLASKPNYDLSSLTPFISQAAYDEIQRREAWLPRAWHPGYTPASPFKLVTALAGLRNKSIDIDEKLLCEGIYRGMKCHVHPAQHGELDLRQAIAQSCNVYFFRCAEKMGHEKLIKEAKDLGMGKKIFLDLPELKDSPIVPDPEWKKKNIGVNWTMEDTFNISIGQGGLRQSPLQMASFVAKLATNLRMVSPTLLLNSKNMPTSTNALIDFSSQKAIVEGMVSATTEGTARRCQIKNLTIAGKTGTGQWRNHNMKLNLAWFVGFAPAHAPRVAISVLVEGVIPQDQVQGGLTAAPVARDLLEAYFAKYPDTLSSSNTRL